MTCSTVTVRKCQAALRTLHGYTFFNSPKCECGSEWDRLAGRSGTPGLVDPECDQFRALLYDHPCLYVEDRDEGKNE